jgi:glyoxylase I family protein
MQGNNDILGGGGFHHIAINTVDFDYTVKFYTEVLGFKEVISWEKEGNRVITLDAGDGACLEVFETTDSTLKAEGAFIHVALSTTRCREVIERVRGAGMEIVKEPTDVVLKSDPPTPVRIAFFKGPNGELFELFESR